MVDKPIHVSQEGGKIDLSQNKAPGDTSKDPSFEVNAINVEHIDGGHNTDIIQVHGKIPTILTHGDAYGTGDVVNIDILSLPQSFGQHKKVTIDMNDGKGHVNITLAKGITYTDHIQTFSNGNKEHYIDLTENGKTRRLIVEDAADVKINGAPIQQTPASPTASTKEK